MQGEQFDGKTLSYLNIYPDDYNPVANYPLVVMLHGFGANMRDLAGLTPYISKTGYVYTCPNAPIPFQLGPDVTGYGWHPPRTEANGDDYRKAEQRLDAYFVEVFEQVNAVPGNIVLLGFSQGGGMTYRCGLGKPDVFAGLVGLSASLPDPEDLRPKLPDSREQPIFIAHGNADPMVSMESAQNTMKFLVDEGYQPDYHEYNMSHEIPPMVIDDLVPWIEKVLPPLVEYQVNHGPVQG
jgi:phospholipase/carboxylesterase